MEHETAQSQSPPTDSPQHAEKRELVLPVLVFGVVEVRRLLRELEALEEFVHQASIREPGKHVALPRVSRILDALAGDNGRNLLQPADRQELKQFLELVEQTAPAIHISFASDPSSSFTARLVKWLRGNIHPATLLQIGLQPTITAGCVVRTANKNFDFSLRHSLSEKRDLLIQALDGAKPAAAPVQPEAEPVLEAPANQEAPAEQPEAKQEVAAS